MCFVLCITLLLNPSYDVESVIPSEQPCNSLGMPMCTYSVDVSRPWGFSQKIEPPSKPTYNGPNSIHCITTLEIKTPALEPWNLPTLGSVLATPGPTLDLERLCGFQGYDSLRAQADY